MLTGDYSQFTCKNVSRLRAMSCWLVRNVGTFLTNQLLDLLSSATLTFFFILRMLFSSLSPSLSRYIKFVNTCRYCIKLY